MSFEDLDYTPDDDEPGEVTVEGILDRTGDRPWAVIDLEALQWDKLRVACALDWAGREYTFKNREQLSGWVERFRGDVWAHAGGRYDFLFLDRPPREVQLSGSGIRRALFGEATLRDSFPLLLASLKAVGKACGVEKYDDKSDRIEELTFRETLEHCQQDCRVLAAGLRSHWRWVAGLPHRGPWRQPTTAGGTAVVAGEALEPDAVDRWRQEAPDIDDILAQLVAVTGGRVEVRTLGYRRNVWVYDRNSSYPASWGLVPVGEWSWTTREHPEWGVYRVEVDQRRCPLPVINVGGWALRGEGWATSEQIARVRQRGGTVKVLGGWAPTGSGGVQIFGEHSMSVLYEAKKDGTQSGAKVAMNSFSGKAGQGLLFHKLTHSPETGWTKHLELTLPAWYQRPLVASYVLSRAALALEDLAFALLQAGWEVYYFDTDCVHTNCPPDRFPLPLSDKRGDWKKEAEAEVALYCGPKMYALRKTEESWEKEKLKDEKASREKVVMKGIPKHRRTWDLMEKVYRAGEEGVDVTCDAGIVTMRSLRGNWGPRASDMHRTVRCQTGGKLRDGDRLTYREYPVKLKRRAA